ncbi:MAG: hypothetical protein CVU42_03945 [Chloroflexi bacterium HGW-Chloroflexi-4]|jgi:methylated-DNA-[protein]-cysteine S-methyltransferase|nr:MAG: hypothetical protein CVU42_03945 [Chloroflexi bacterium HGW-Chloroflexi-4]
MNHIATIDHLTTDIGAVRVTASAEGILQVHLLGRTHQPKPTKKDEPSSQALDHATAALEQILEYLEGRRLFFNLPIDWSLVSTFQKQVLEITQFIPFGETLSYGQIAAKLGKPRAGQAVGGALGRNPIPIIIPCHRVVAANGNLTGFSAADGILTKTWLLELEGRKIVAQKLV